MNIEIIQIVTYDNVCVYIYIMKKWKLQKKRLTYDPLPTLKVNQSLKSWKLQFASWKSLTQAHICNQDKNKIYSLNFVSNT